MSKKKFNNYLINLGFSEKEISKSINGNIFTYSPSSFSPAIKYLHVENEIEVFTQHLQFWNKNKDNVFIAVDKTKTYVVDCKKKPNVDGINRRNIFIKTFDYGVSSKGYEDISIELISKDYIDSSIFYKFIQKNQRKKQEVDKDLLLNLIALRNDLATNGNDKYGSFTNSPMFIC